MKIICDNKIPDSLKIKDTTLNCIFIDLKDIENIIEEQNQYFVYGSVNFCKHLINKYPKNFTNNWHDQYLFDYSYFSSKLKPYLFNKDQIYMPFCFLQDFLDTYRKDSLFIRSNSGDKTIPGQIINTNEKNIISTLKQLYHVQDETMIVLSSTKNITQETRFWISNNKVIGISNYSWGENKYSFIPEKSKQLADVIVNLENQIAPFYVLDIAYDQPTNESFVLEANSLHSSGFYSANVFEIMKEIVDD
jgi:hypothetical protein